MDIKEALAKAPIFAALRPDLVDSLAAVAKVAGFKPGDLLVREAEEAAAFFVLLRGYAEVVKGFELDGEQVIGHLSEGDFFGEMALLDGFPRSASVLAVRDCECLVLMRDDFLTLVRNNVDVALAILPVLSRRLRDCEDQLLP